MGPQTQQTTNDQRRSHDCPQTPPGQPDIGSNTDRNQHSGHDAGDSLQTAGHCLIGAVPVRSSLRLRFDYGHVVPWVRHHPGQMVAVAGPDAVRLDTPAPTHGQDWATVSELTVRAGDRVPFVLTWHHSNEDAPAVADPEVALRKTLAFWSQWSQKGTPVTGPYREAITRSLLRARDELT